MNSTRHKLVNVLIAVSAALLFGAFVFLGTRDGDSNNRVATTATTSTTRATTTTTFVEETTTTTEAPATTTTAVQLVTTTTAKKVTTTTAKPTGTTAKPTTTTAKPGPTGQATEGADNAAGFTVGANTFSSSPTSVNDGSGSLGFSLAITKGGEQSGETQPVNFIVRVVNNTGRTITFPTGFLVVNVNLRTGGGADLQFAIDSRDAPGGPITSLPPGAKATITQTRGITGYSTYDMTATCVVDYGS